MSEMRLVADIGGTNIRLAWQRGTQSPLLNIRLLRCADYPTLEAAVHAYLTNVSAPAPVEAAFGIAHAVTGDEVRMTNHGWSFSKEALKKALGLRRLLVINDFTALALALPHLPQRSLRQVGGIAAEPGEPIALVGPGTGLGISGLIFSPEVPRGIPICGEGGHATLAAESALETDVLSIIRQHHGHVSAERAVSGPGLVEIYQALRQLASRPGDRVAQAADVTRLALSDGDPLALQTLELFCGFLGSVAGNVALTLGARGGVFIGGGIVARLGALFDGSPFRSRFESKGRMKGYLARIPCWVLDPGEFSALTGAALALDRREGT